MKVLGLGLVQVLVLAAAACGGDPQVVLELSGVADVDRVEILLLEPVVQAKEQRHNTPELDAAGTLETVYYMEERTRLDVSLAELRDANGEPKDPVRVEIRGAGGAYVPFVRAWSGGTLRALGVYEPTRIFAAKLGVEHGPAAVEPVSDVTIFPIQLEPAIQRAPAMDIPQAVKRGEVMEVACETTGETSGYVWRLADGHELRVLAALPRVSGEGSRLDPADLDCDEHSPGRAQVARGSVGDQLDCDDAASAIHGGARERCSVYDEDCNPETKQALTLCTSGACGGAMFCACQDGGSTNGCLEQVGTACTVPVTASGDGRTACDSAGELPLPLRCLSGCEVMLAWAPDWLDVKISDTEGGQPYGLGAWASMTDGRAYLVVGGDAAITSESLPGLVVHVRAGGLISNHAIKLDLLDGTCGSPSQLVCK